MTEENGFHVFTEPFNGGYDNESLNPLLTDITGDSETVHPNKHPKSNRFVYSRATGIMLLPVLAKVNKDTVKYDEHTGDILISCGEHTLKFDKIEKYSRKSQIIAKDILQHFLETLLRIFTRCLWIFIINKVTDKKDFDTKELSLKFSAEEVAYEFGLVDGKDLRKNIQKSLLELWTLSLPFRAGKSKDPHPIHISAGAGSLGNGAYQYIFTKQGYELLMSTPLMKMNDGFFRLNRQKYPNSPSIYLKLAEDINQNIGKGKREGVCSVRTLLRAAPFIPSEQEVRNEDKHYTRRISNILDGTLEHLVSKGLIKEFLYTHSKGQPLTSEEAETSSFLNWSNYQNLYVHVTFADFPYEEIRKEAIENRKKRRTATKKAQARKVKAAQSKADVDASATEQADKKKNLRP